VGLKNNKIKISFGHRQKKKILTPFVSLFLDGSGLLEPPSEVSPEAEGRWALLTVRGHLWCGCPSFGGVVLFFCNILKRKSKINKKEGRTKKKRTKKKIKRGEKKGQKKKRVEKGQKKKREKKINF
jgi:hypothetical protein